MAWALRGTVYYMAGITRSNNVAAFDFDHTLAQSDSGLVFMRTPNDWVPTVELADFSRIFGKLVADNWTIVVFTNQLENNPAFTQQALARIHNFFNDYHIRDLNINPHIYVSIANDQYRKPNRGMWDLFLNDIRLIPTEASFYCGDAFGPASDNPLYQWADYDLRFAEACNIAYYTPDEILETFYSPTVPEPIILLIMAAHESQYRYYVNDLKIFNPNYYETNLEGVGRGAIVVGERLATRAGRRRAYHIIPKEYHRYVKILMFTRPIRPFLTEKEFKDADMQIRGYANALDVHPNFLSKVETGEPFPIYRIN